MMATKNVYMLDTCICSFIMRENPVSVLQKLQQVSTQHSIVISAITYAEMRYGCFGKKASPKHSLLVDQFITCLDNILPWDIDAVDCSAKIKKELSELGTPIGGNDTAIAGHAISQKCILVTNNIREFKRVNGLVIEDWVH
ncbi:type II toxin-antitoxin system VapC family toxin [Pseudocolwellia agarivorans]|uniref:type II toxin-antitoxin system VapC family toxin n=1 Tax=Pseudocolwellia agarivorans TaxID=1911682 RepID=UPI001FE43192|nr:type II toxin-antitoxin system VapC family toxin [Pseudocolwellia agarivorans]